LLPLFHAFTSSILEATNLEGACHSTTRRSSRGSVRGRRGGFGNPQYKMSATTGMRGLNIFIQDVRNAANKEVEQERVDKELANIRKKFKKVKDMTPYDRKK
jgi:hypothetical protein|tara:strand:+ start:6848 stop:7153 length:306 start_codon:yes stop_codon:yes gene_type:complete